MNNYKVYLLKHTIHNKTYLGITNNLQRRIRQHNGELVGGAKYTTANKGTGQWVLHCHIDNVTKNESLSLERIIKNKRRKGRGKTPLERRIYLITQVLTDKYNSTDKLIYNNNN